MARRGWSTSNYLDYSAAVLTGAPLTLAGWAKTSVTGVAQIVMALRKYSQANLNQNGVDIRITGGNAVSIAVCDASFAQANAPGTITANVWFHFAGVFASATSYTAYRNGAAGTTATGSRTPSGIDRTLIGVTSQSSAPINPLAPSGTGDIAWPAIWNAALTTSDIGSLAAGASPLLVRPDALVAYWPLDGEFSPENNRLSNTAVMTMVGTLTRSDGPGSLFGAG